MAAALAESRAERAWVKLKRKDGLLTAKSQAWKEQEEDEQQAETAGWSKKFKGITVHETVPPLTRYQGIN
ncbi:MAG: hypothetical protein NPIRA06_30060 [Nitrospirales bacterium]|nr:MAG: hypothetical protein NPIRA06_30060 [Nitrospirales bacterium]